MFRPAANPCPLEFLGTLFVLLVVFTLWRSIRPRRHVLLRCYAGAGATVAFLAIMFQACDGDRCVSIDGSYRLALESALLVSASLFVEILLSRRRHALARAVARRRRSRDS